MFCRLGWGEFPVRDQLHLNDVKGRKVDIIHNLKLDRTYTGEQNLGAETHADVEVEAPVQDLSLPKRRQLQVCITLHKFYM